jgi:hypothetical protein
VIRETPAPLVLTVRKVLLVQIQLLRAPKVLRVLTVLRAPKVPPVRTV